MNKLQQSFLILYIFLISTHYCFSQIHFYSQQTHFYSDFINWDSISKKKIKTIKIFTYLYKFGEVDEGSKLLKYQFSYDEKGRNIEEIRHPSSEDLKQFEGYTYQIGSKGETLIEYGLDENNDPESEFFSKTIFKYDTLQNTVTKTIYLFNGNILMTLIDYFNNKNQKIKIDRFADNELVNSIIYKYNNMGQLVSELNTFDMKTKGYYYDNYQKLVRATECCSAGNSMQDIYQYDNLGRLKTIIEYNYDGTISFYKDFKIGESGLIEEELITDKLKQPVFLHRAEYSFY